MVYFVVVELLIGKLSKLLEFKGPVVTVEGLGKDALNVRQILDIQPHPVVANVERVSGVLGTANGNAREEVTNP